MLCTEEKSQMPALDRTQPSLLVQNGRAGTMIHNYERDGTSTPFAALEVAASKGIGQCLPRHRHVEFVSSCAPSTVRSPRAWTCT